MAQNWERNQVRTDRNLAVNLAHSHLKSLSPAERLVTRYVWRKKVPALTLKFPNGIPDLRSLRTIFLTMNFNSQGDFIYRPRILNDGWLVCVNLLPYDPKFETWRKVWEELSYCPDFALLFTRDFIKFNAGFINRMGLTSTEVRDREWVEKKNITWKGGVYKWPEGTFGLEDPSNPSSREISERELEAGEWEVNIHHRVRAGGAAPSVNADWISRKFDADKVDVVRLNALDFDQAKFTEMQQMTGSLAPIVSDDYLKVRMLNSIEEDGLFKAVFSGLYFRFRGVSDDLDGFFAALGVGCKGETFEQVLARTRSDMWAGMKKSNVSGKKRAFFQANAQTAEADSKVFVTLDVRDKDVDLFQNFMANIQRPFEVVQAYEVIAKGNNKLPVVGLFNAQKKRQDEAPSGQGGVVDNHKMPFPQTHRLFAIGSCIFCHGVDTMSVGDQTVDTNFYQPIHNDVANLYANDFDLNRFPPLIADDPRLRLIGQWTRNFEKHLNLSRLDYADAVRECVELAPGSVWEDISGQGLKHVARLASQYLADEYNHRMYALVTAEDALRDVGYDLPDLDGETSEQRALRAAREFDRLIPVTILSSVAGIITEDPRIKCFRPNQKQPTGSSEPWTDWALVRSFVAASVRWNLVPASKKAVRGDAPDAKKKAA
jgi:hypothetical protein